VYDSTEDTKKHAQRVMSILNEVVESLGTRALVHDRSKLEDPEKAIFDEFTPKLRDTTYGGEEYKGFLVEMKVALDHHYRENRHHPEHFGDNGITEMSLIDLLEMLADWKAAGERHADGSMAKSLVAQEKRFHISPELMKILWNTVRELGWLHDDAQSRG